MSPDIDRLAISLLHFLWQGAAIGLVVVWTRRLYRDAHETRYAAGILGLLAMLLAPVATYLALAPDVALPTAPDLLESAAPVSAVPPPADDGSAIAPWASAWPDLPWRLFVVVTWATGTLVGAGRTLCGWLLLRGLRTRAQNAVDGWRSWLVERSHQLRVPCPRLLVSIEAVTPMLVGWLRPAIVMPLGVMSDLPPAQIEALLTHELIHLRRWDHVANLLQILAETLLFYHPAVWWLSRAVRDDRELCCDRRAAQTLGAARYAGALVAAEELRAAAPPAMAVAAGGGRLVDRIRILVDQPATGEPMRHPLRTHLVAVITVVAAVASLAGATAVRVWQPQEVVGDERARIYADINDGGAIRIIALGGGTPSEDVVAALQGLARELEVDIVYLRGQTDSVAVDSVRTGLEAAGLRTDIRWAAPTAVTQTLPATFTVPVASPDVVTVEVFDMQGTRVHTLFKAPQPAGEHEITWRAEDFHPKPGVFLVRLKAGDFEQMRKVVVTE